jgi:hypothetical protein
MGVRLVCVSVAIAFIQFVERVVCMCMAIVMGASMNAFHHCHRMVRARTLSGMLHTHLMRLIESWVRVVCVLPFHVGGAAMTVSSKWLAHG